FPAADDHVALAVDEMNEAALVAAPQVAHAAVAAGAQRFRRPRWIIEIAVEGVRRAREELADLAVRDFVSLVIQDLHGAGAGPLASDRAQVIDLLVGAQQRDPT